LGCWGIICKNHHQTSKRQFIVNISVFKGFPSKFVKIEGLVGQKRSFFVKSSVLTGRNFDTTVKIEGLELKKVHFL